MYIYYCPGGGVDLLPEEKRDKYLKKAVKCIRASLAGTKFSKAPVVPVSAKKEASLEQGGAGEVMGRGAGIPALVEELCRFVPNVKHQIEEEEDFFMHIDHCFSVKGQGTVVTGTVASGKLKIGQTVEFPDLKITRKVKSIQAFHTSVSVAKAGDRIGACIQNLPSSSLERGIMCEPGELVLCIQCCHVACFTAIAHDFVISCTCRIIRNVL